MRRRSAERERLTTVWRRYARVFSGSRTRFARRVHADERLLDDVLAGGGVVEQQRREAEQRPVVGAVGLGEVVDRGAGCHRCRQRPRAATAAGGPRSGHGRDHRHAAGRAGPPERAHWTRLRTGPHRCEVEYLCHASWTRFPPSGLYARGTAFDAASTCPHAYLLFPNAPFARRPHPDAARHVTRAVTHAKTLPARLPVAAGRRGQSSDDRNAPAQEVRDQQLAHRIPHASSSQSRHKCRFASVHRPAGSGSRRNSAATSSAICAVFSAAPLRRLSPQTNSSSARRVVQRPPHPSHPGRVGAHDIGGRGELAGGRVVEQDHTGRGGQDLVRPVDRRPRSRSGRARSASAW